MTAMGSPPRTAKGSRDPFEGAQLTRVRTPDPASPGRYKSTVSVKFPDDDLLTDEFLPDAERERLLQSRKAKEVNFWNHYVGPTVDLQVDQVLKEYVRTHRELPPVEEPYYR